jgi:hypothetical protein
VRCYAPSFLLALILALAMYGPRAQAQGLITSTRASFWTSDRNATSQQDITQLELAFRYSFNMSDGVHLISRGAVFVHSKEAKDPDFELQQGYARWDIGPLDLRLGRQIASWGRSDGINPTDVFSARDYTRMLADDEENQLGIGALQVTYAQKERSFSFIYAPEFRSTVLPNGEAKALQIDSHNLVPAPEAQFGVRLNTVNANFDWSVSASYVNDRIGTILPGSANRETPQYLFAKVATIGADFETEKNGFGLRGEIAFSQFERPDFDVHLPVRERLSIVLGAERTFGPQLRVALQIIANKVDGDACAEGCTQTVSGTYHKLNLVRQVAWRPIVTGFTLNVHQNILLDRAFWEVRGVAYVEGGSSVQLRAGYQLSDEVAVILGVDRAHGNANTYFGALKDNASTFLMLRKGF